MQDQVHRIIQQPQWVCVQWCSRCERGSGTGPRAGITRIKVCISISCDLCGFCVAQGIFVVVFSALYSCLYDRGRPITPAEQLRRYQGFAGQDSTLGSSETNFDIFKWNESLQIRLQDFIFGNGDRVRSVGRSTRNIVSMW